MFSANTGNELRVQTLVVDLCVRCEAKLLEIALLNGIPVIFDIIFISMYFNIVPNYQSLTLKVGATDIILVSSHATI